MIEQFFKFKHLSDAFLPPKMVHMKKRVSRFIERLNYNHFTQYQQPIPEMTCCSYIQMKKSSSNITPVTSEDVIERIDSLVVDSPQNI